MGHGGEGGVRGVGGGMIFHPLAADEKSIEIDTKAERAGGRAERAGIFRVAGEGRPTRRNLLGLKPPARACECVRVCL